MPFGRLGVFEVTDARVGDRGLPIERQADRLDRLDRERLMSFDQCPLVGEIVNTDCVSGIEGSPERSEYLEPHPSAAVAR